MSPVMRSKRTGRESLARAVRVGHGGAAATPPTNPHPPVSFVKINRSGEHQQPGHYQILTSPGAASEPATGDDPSALRADVVAALRHLTEMINYGLELRPFRG